MAEGVIEHRSYARVCLLGNPSDVYFGRTISFSLSNFWATVVLRPSDELVITPHRLAAVLPPRPAAVLPCRHHFYVATDSLYRYQ
ncbi:unnamed protein product [Linum trigynum]|uniref:Uncharacterized protein n=1 Tax=Linum trigynum TaxID=586398 RepID=A0AAV2DVU0_9ROSI